MNLNELRDKAYRCAVKHGWHEEEYSNEHFLCLVISELMEAVEADRSEKHTNRYMDLHLSSFTSSYRACMMIKA